MAEQLLKLAPSHADWLAHKACYLLGDAGESFHRGGDFNFEMLEVDRVADEVEEVAELILELRGDRQTTRITTAKDIATGSSDEIIRHLGREHMDVLRATKGFDRRDAERARDKCANEARFGLEILDAIEALREERR